MATFQKPFLGDGIFDIFSSIVKDETPSIQNLYSKELNRILKMLFFLFFVCFRKKIMISFVLGLWLKILMKGLHQKSF